MLSLYRSLLYLYPAAYRREYGDEMAGVFCEAQSATKKDFRPRASFFLKEVVGLLNGAMHEHWRAVVGSHASMSLWSSRRFTMRSGFRFPKSTAALMAVILAGVALTIEKARPIVASAGEPDYPDLFGGTVVLFVTACVLAGAGWAVLFALRRSGVHRLAEVAPTVAGETTQIRLND
jgi:hypothetical protein